MYTSGVPMVFYTRRTDASAWGVFDDVRIGCPPTEDPAREFRRGDCNADGDVDLSDAVRTLGVLFLGEETPGCLDACDSNDDGVTDISDAVATLGALFLGDPAPPAPGMHACGPDPSDDELDCQDYPPCP
jgi:hypothetical protein